MDIEKIKSALDALGDCRYDITSQSEDEVCIRIMKTEMKVSDVPIGAVFKIGDFEFVKLGTEYCGVAALLKSYLWDDKFDINNNDYTTSKIRKRINGEFLEKLEKEIGDDGVIAHNVDLTSVDGLRDYASVYDKVSLMTLDRYRNYRKHIPPYKNAWWLATPFSCKLNGYTCLVSSVYGDGVIDSNNCNYAYAVRPFCIFRPSVNVVYG